MLTTQGHHACDIMREGRSYVWLKIVRPPSVGVRLRTKTSGIFRRIWLTHFGWRIYNHEEILLRIWELLVTNCSKSIVSELGGLANQKAKIHSFGFQLKEKDRKPAPSLPPEVLFLLSFVLAIPDSSLLFLGSGRVLLSYFVLLFVSAFLHHLLLVLFLSPEVPAPCMFG